MSDYKIDSLAIQEKSQSIALEKFGEIESNCQLSPVAFVKENHTFKKIRERLTEPHFGVTLGVMMAKVCAYAGIKNEITDHDKFDIGRAIKNRFSDLSCEEFMKAFENERHGIYAERTEHFQLFNAEYVTSVLNKYKKWRQETKIAHNISINPQSQLPQMSPDAEREILIGATIRLFEEFKEAKEVSIPCAYIFDFLYTNKFFPEDTNYQDYYQIAYRDLKSELKQSKPSSKMEHNAVKEAILKLESANNEKILVKAKRLVLHHFFQKLIDEKKDINEILK